MSGIKRITEWKITDHLDSPEAEQQATSSIHCCHGIQVCSLMSPVPGLVYHLCVQHASSFCQHAPAQKKQDLKNSEGWSRRFTACPGEALCALSLQTHWVRGNEEFPFLSEIQKVTFIYSLCLQYDTNFRESEWTKSLHVCPQGQKNSLENLTGHLVISIPVLH